MSPSLPQILIILAIVLLIFGPKKIPGIGKALGEAIRGFKKGVSDDERDITPENEKLDAQSSSTPQTSQKHEKEEV